MKRHRKRLAINIAEMLGITETNQIMVISMSDLRLMNMFSKKIWYQEYRGSTLNPT